jgi:hypothetical protein
MTRLRRRSSLWLLAVPLALVACSSGGSTGSRGSSSASPSLSASPAAGQSAGATTASGSSPQGAGDGVPVTDAGAFRDRLLEMAQAIQFDANASASSNATKILTAWLTTYPTLQPVLFSSQEATPTRISYDQSFLIVRQPGSWDQSLSLAVADTQGNCTGGAIVIPGTPTAVSDATVPTLFVRVALPAGAQCSAGTVNETYKPGP